MFETNGLTRVDLRAQGPDWVGSAEDFGRADVRVYKFEEEDFSSPL